MAGRVVKGAPTIVENGERLSDVVKEMCKDLGIEDQAGLVKATGLSPITVRRLWNGARDGSIIDEKTGTLKKRKIGSTLEDLTRLCRQRGASAELVDRLRAAAGRAAGPKALSPGRTREQSVGHLLKVYRGAATRKSIARHAFPELAETDLDAAMDIVERVEEMKEGDYPPAQPVQALVRAVTEVQALQAGDVRHLAVAYLWLQNVVESRTRRNLIGVLVSSTEYSAFWTEMVKGCIAFASRHPQQYLVVPCHHEESMHREIGHLEELSRIEELGGIVICPVRGHADQAREEGQVLHLIAEFRERHVPVVVVDRLMRGMNVLPHVVPDNEGIGRRAAKVFLDHGHRRLGVLLDLNNREPHTAREKGFVDEVTAFNQRPGEAVTLIVEYGAELPPGRSASDDDFRGLKQAAIRLLYQEPSAIFCSTSQAALQLLAAMDSIEGQQKLEPGAIRRAVSILSGDDVPILAARGIDCILYRGDDLARHAMNMLTRLIDDPSDRASQGSHRLDIDNVASRGSLKAYDPDTDIRWSVAPMTGTADGAS